MITTYFKFQGNLRYWLQDPDCFDHYSVIYEGGEKTAIFQNSVHLSSVRDPTLIEERNVSEEHLAD